MPAVDTVEAEIRRLIGLCGPMPVAQFMSLCLSHPEHGYYMTRDPFGRAGDFVTAPEISQMFGELIGLWAASVWKQMGAPDNVRLIELGPGRGTLMQDALRALRVMPEFRAALAVSMVEISPSLRARQQQALAGADVPVLWHDALRDIPEGPFILIANEFVDALPVHQAVKQADGWHQRLVGIDADGRFAFDIAPSIIPHFEPVLPPKVRAAPVGAVYEWRDDTCALEIGRRVVDSLGAALIVDYGHVESAPGDTFQSVRQHAFADPLDAPGHVDLTAHVDFQAFAAVAEAMGARVHGPVAQGELLRRLGIEARAAALRAHAPRDVAADIDVALARLTGGGRQGMGTLFKAMALTYPSLAPLPGFEE